MGTRADFYIGRGSDATWIGSVAYDGYPSGIDADLLKITNETIWKDQVKLFIMRKDHGTLPEQGWPWPWENSNTTDYAYAFEDGKVYASCFGHGWFDPLQEEPEHTEEKTCVFPDMSDRQNVTFGRRSGLMILGATGIMDMDAVETNQKGE